MVRRRIFVSECVAALVSAFIVLTCPIPASAGESKSGWFALGTGVTGGSVMLSRDEPPLDGSVDHLAIGPDGALYAAGNFEKAGGAKAANIAKWDGAQWSALGLGMWNIGPVVVASKGIYFAGGLRLDPSGKNGVQEALFGNVIHLWDGASWSDIPSPNAFIYAMAAAPDGTLYVGGTVPSSGIKTENVFKWDSKTWTPLGSGLENSNKGFVTGIRTLKVAPDGTLYAGGIFTSIGGVKANSIAKWNGKAWSALGTGIGGGKGMVHALAIAPDGTLYAGGAFDAKGAYTNVGKWDGTSWSSVGSSTNTVMDGMGVDALVLAPDGTLYVAGGGKKANVAKWDGKMWSGLGTGVDNNVNALAVGPDGTLYAGGWFKKAGGIKVNFIARWLNSK